MAKILVADADPDQRGLVVFALRFAGYQVLEATRIENADRILREDHPDLIVLDETLPGFRQGEHFQDRKLPVVVITKPVSPDELTHKVTLSLKKSSSRRQTAHP